MEQFVCCIGFQVLNEFNVVLIQKCCAVRLMDGFVALIFVNKKRKLSIVSKKGIDT